MPLLRRMLMDMKKWMRCAAAVVLSVLVAFSDGVLAAGEY